MTRKNKTVAKIKSTYVNQYNAQMERNQRRKKRLIQRLVFVSIVFIVAFSVMTTYHFKQKSMHAEKQDELNELKDKFTALEKEEKQLLEEIDLLNDDEYILDIARTNYFLSKKGELIFLVEDEQKRSY